MRVVVIGAGVIGLGCGYELLRRGADVTVLDRGEIGEGASWGNAGWVTPSFSTPLPAPGLIRSSLGWLLRSDSPLSLRPQLSPEFARWLWTFARHCNRSSFEAGLRALAALNGQTFELFDRWEEELPPFEVHRSGMLLVYTTREGMDHGFEELEALHAVGFPALERLDGEAVRALEPALSGAVIGGALIERERHVLPQSLTRALAESLRLGGATLRTGVKVRDFSHQGGAISDVVVDGDAVAGDAFVLGAGAWSGRLARLAGFRLPVEAGTGYSVTIERPQFRVHRPLYLSEAKIAVSPFDDSLRLAGMMDLSGVGARLNPARLEVLRRGTSRYLAETWKEGGGEQAWIGLRPITPDGLPAIGRAPGLSNLYVATGHGMLGVTLAPATARAIAEMICGVRSGTELEAFDPGRFA